MLANLDTAAPHFRQLMERWPDASTLKNHYQAVAESFEGNQHGLVETVKSFVECVCLTILGEFGKPMPSSTPSTTEMLVETLRILGLQNTREGGNLGRILSAHNKLADALSDMRNENGPIAHGKDGFLDALTQNQIRTYLLTADTLLALLMAALEGTEPDLQFTREPYERFSHLHDRIDGSITIESSVEYEEDTPVLVVKMQKAGLSDGIELRIEPSRLLYAIDRTAFIELLVVSAAQSATATAATVKQAEVVPAVDSPAPPVATPLSVLIPTYDGLLTSLTEELQRYVESLNLPPLVSPPAGAELTESILGTAEANMGTDWREREALQARMKVALRRTLSQFGFPDEVAKDSAEHLVTWFRIQTGGLPNGAGGATQ